MAITIILICLLIDHFLPPHYWVRRHIWFTHYYHWLKGHFHVFLWWPRFGVFIVIAPILITYILFATLVDHLLGTVGYYALALIVLWCVMDARLELSKNTEEALELFTNHYERIFAPIFWLLILGSTGVVLYASVAYLRKSLIAFPDQSSNALLSKVVVLQGVLDWIPLKLLGLTYALAGHFSPVFGYWYKHLLTGIQLSREILTHTGLIALGFAPEKKSMTEQEEPVFVGLLNRSLWVWLVVIALVTIGRWVG